MKYLEKAIKKINTIFINVLLIISYFSIFGLASVLYRLLNRESEKKESYWVEDRKKYSNKKYFESPY